MITIDKPDDFLLSTVSSVELRSQPEWFFEKTNMEANSTSSMLPALKIEISSTTDLQEFYREKAPLMSSQIYFCDSPKERFLVSSTSNLYWNGRVIIPEDSYGGQSTDTLDTKNHENRFTYYFFISVAGKEALHSPLPPDWSYPPIRSYNLQKKPEKICFYIRGTNWPSFIEYKSNAVTIPPDVIKQALREPSSTGLLIKNPF